MLMKFLIAFSVFGLINGQSRLYPASDLKHDFSDSSKIQVSFIPPATIIKIRDGHYFIDFGKAAFGTVMLKFAGLQKDSIRIRLGEKRTEGNAIDRKPGGTIRYQQLTIAAPAAGKEFALALNRDKRNTSGQAVMLPDSIGVIMPFRYCEIENLQIPIEQLSVKQKVFNYRFNDTNSGFSSSDSILDQVWNMGKHTIKATSFAGLYIDGDRERIPYEADAYINQLSHYAVDNEYDIARQTNDYFMSHPTWPTEWILHTVLLFYEDYRYTGDLQPLRKHYEGLRKKTLVDLAREDGLITVKNPKVNNEFMRGLGFTDVSKKLEDIVDWPAANMFPTGNQSAMGERDGYVMQDINTVVNAFYYRNLVLMTEIARLLGKKEDVSFFMQKSALVKKTINDKLFDRERGVYIDGEGTTHASLHGNMFPLAFGLVPENDQKSVTAFLKSRGMACSVYGAQFLLEALYQQGEADYAMDLMTTKSDRGWYNMIAAGSTMALEAWDLKYKSNLDWNHAWGTAPVNVVTRYVWGVTPLKPGFASVQVKPMQGKLSFSNIRVPTGKGIVTGEFKRTNNTEEAYKLVLPGNMTGEFIIPSRGKVKNAKSKNGKVTLNPGINEIKVNY